MSGTSSPGSSSTKMKSSTWVFFEQQAERHGFDPDAYLRRSARAFREFSRATSRHADALLREVGGTDSRGGVLQRRSSRSRWRNTSGPRLHCARSERTFRIVAENTYDWEFWTDEHQRFLYCSPSCQRVTGHEASEFIADGMLLQRIMHPGDRAAWLAHTLDHSGRVTFRIMRTDGTVRWIEHLCQEVFAENGSSLGRRGSNRDITDLVRAADVRLSEGDARHR